MSPRALGWAALAAALGASGCAGARTPAAPARAPEAVPKQLQSGQIIVALAGGASAAARQAIAQDHDLAERGSFPLASIGVECVVYQVAPGRSVPELLARLARDPRVVLAERNEVFRGRGGPAAAPPEPLAYGAALIRADAAQRTRTGRGVRVAVIDTGVARDHPGLHGRVTATQNFVEGGERSFDRDRHGTAVAGVIAAGGPGARAPGVAPDAEVLALKACWYDGGGAGTALCSSWTLAKALDFAIGAGARIVNLSLSGPDDELLARLVARAHERGVITVAAADEADDGPGFPASSPSVVAVLASDDHGRVRRPGWMREAAEQRVVAAPGVDVLTTVPDGGWDFLTGTSIAAAHVTGVLALMLEQRPGLAPDEAAAVLDATAQAAPDGAAAAGRGGALVDACAALARVMGVPTCP